MDEDVRLMLALRAGDGAAFDALFARWSAPLLRYLERLVREPALAEELAQEVFLRVYRARERYEPDARFSTWLFTIATRLAWNELRRPRHRNPHEPLEGDEEMAPLPLASGAPAADAVVEARRTGALVEQALDRLPERQRAALWLAAVEGLSYAEVAALLETTERSVKALVHRARTALADHVRALRRADPGAGAPDREPGRRLRGAT
ncbi:MAG: sigma-70 family RNA polymerase sigma factor [Deltaproteobacteria bacterium]|nr:sigma-70 family RNA polymerase sigma factor [Deltaproteobacteria bacterium]